MGRNGLDEHIDVINREVSNQEKTNATNLKSVELEKRAIKADQEQIQQCICELTVMSASMERMLRPLSFAKAGDDVRVKTNQEMGRGSAGVDESGAFETGTSPLERDVLTVDSLLPSAANAGVGMFSLWDYPIPSSSLLPGTIT
jgi:hypothetical protein